MSDVESVAWRLVPGFPDYECSTDGRIRRATPCRTAPAGFELKCKPDKHGYLKASLSLNGKVTNTQVHRVVALTWLGPPPSDSHQVAHKNGIRADCALSNLRWATPAENAEDRKVHGNWMPARGGRHSQAVLDEKKVLEIKDGLRRGVRKSVLADRYGISRPTISDIVSGRTWSHV